MQSLMENSYLLSSLETKFDLRNRMYKIEGGRPGFNVIGGLNEQEAELQ